MVERQYVIFKLEDEEYGVDIKNVREITVNKTTTRIPNTPDFIDGVINIRGDTIPIIDLKKRFNIAEKEINGKAKRIIIVNVEDKLVGFIVDDASQVIRINTDDIENPPEILTGINRSYISGIGKVNERIIVLIDLERLLSYKERNIIQNSFGEDLENKKEN
ncbi:chemotaxis protein CheW [Lutispora sp.]|uniref:chemotaxis protein CheW n=1 Tax=Lutispora sp. TaxID=2828727 RepID=UPI0035688042